MIITKFFYLFIFWEKKKHIDYYMLRARYRFYARVFNTIWYGIKSERMKMISGS